MTGASAPLADFAPLTNFGMWARTSLLEIIMLVLGAVLLTRLAEWLRGKITAQNRRARARKR